MRLARGRQSIGRVHAGEARRRLEAFAFFGSIIAASIWSMFVPEHWELYFLGAASLGVALWLMPHYKAGPAFQWWAAFYWIAIAADVVKADLEGRTLASNEVKAIVLSFASLVAISLGARIGLGWNSYRQAASEGSYAFRFNLNRLLLVYLVLLLGVLPAARLVSHAVTGLFGVAVALTLLKYALVFLIAGTVFAREKNYEYLVAIIFVEVLFGFTGFFATYKEAIFAILIAAIARAGSRRSIAVAVGILVFVSWLSLVWTSIKGEFRSVISGGTMGQMVTIAFDDRVSWLEQRLNGGDVDYSEAAGRLLDRIGYTGYYAMTLERFDSDLLSGVENRWVSAVWHVLTPRFFFADKEALSDSAVTALFTGVQSNEMTSISVGYLAEAHVGFGLFWMFPALVSIGLLMGVAARWLAALCASPVIVQACTTAMLLLSFPYGANIDGSLGGFITRFIVLSVCVWMGGGWLRRFSSA